MNRKAKNLKKKKKLKWDDNLYQSRYTYTPMRSYPSLTVDNQEAPDDTADNYNYISFEDFRKQIKDYAGSINAVNWLSLIDDDLMRVLYDRIALEGEQYSDAKTFLIDNIRPITRFIWDTLEYVDVPYQVVEINDFYNILKEFIEDYYDRNDINGVPEMTDDERDRILDSAVFQSYYTSLYKAGLVTDVLADEIEEAKTDKPKDQNDLTYYDDEYRQQYPNNTMTIDDIDDIYDFYWYIRQSGDVVTQEEAEDMWPVFLEQRNDLENAQIETPLTPDNTALTPSEVAELLKNGETKRDNSLSRDDLTTSQIAELLAKGSNPKDDLRRLSEQPQRYSGQIDKLYDDPSTLNGAYMYYYKNSDGTYTGVYNVNGKGDKWYVIEDYTPYPNNTELTQSNYKNITGLPDTVYNKFYSEDTTLEDNTALEQPSRYSGQIAKLYDDPSTLNGAYMYYYENDDGTYTGVYNVGGKGDKWYVIEDYTPYPNNTELTQSNYADITGLPDTVYNKFYSEDTTLEDMEGYTLPPLDDNTKKQPSIVEGEGLDSATTEAKPIGRNPATTTNRLFYDPKYDSMGVKNSDYYYYVDESGNKIMYLYDNINNVFQLVSNNWTASTTGMNEINEDTYQTYNFLPDELYNKFQPATVEPAEPVTTTTNDYTSDDYIKFSTVQIPQYLGKNDAYLEGDNYDTFSQSLYDLYTQSGAVSVKRFLVDFRSVQQQITNYAYDENKYEFPDQATLDNTAIDYYKNYGYTSTVDPNNLSFNSDGVSVIQTGQTDLSNTILPAPKQGVIYSVLNPDTNKYLILQMDDNGQVNVLDQDLTQTDMLNKYAGSTQITYDDWDKMTTLQTDTTDTTDRNLTTIETGKNYAVEDGKGTYSIIRQNEDGTLTTLQQNVGSDKLSNLANYAGVLPQEDYNNLVKSQSTVEEVEVNPDGTIKPVDVPDTATTDPDVEVVSDASVANSAIDNSINILQQTDYVGEVDINTKETISQNPRIQAIYDENNVIDQADEDDYYEYGDNKTPFIRLDGSDKRITNKEYDIIKDSWRYDRDITKPFTIDKNMKSYTEEYQTEYVNEHEYFYMLSNNSEEFYDWLDLRKSGEESRSYMAYSLANKIEASNIDIENYLKTGKLSQLIRGVDYKGNVNNNNRASQESITNVGDLGNNNIASFILSASSCCMFGTMIMENIKKIADTQVISNFDSSIKSSDFSKLDDIIFSGMYPKDTMIRNAIENNIELDRNRKNILQAIFSERSYKTLKDIQISNRYSSIILKFFGSTDDRMNALNNDSGKILFNLALVYLSYFSSFLNNNTTLGINTDVKSNLLLITSTFLEVLYPAIEYDSQLIKAIDAMIILCVNEIRSAGRGNTETSEADLMMIEVVNRILDLVGDLSRPDIMIDEYINKDTMVSLIGNFGAEIFRNTRTREDLVKFIVNGMVDTSSYLETSKRMMVTILGEKFDIDNTVMFDVLGMNTVQANIFLNNPKYNMIIPMIKPETIGIVPERKIDVTLTGFAVPIRGLLLKAVEEDVITTILDQDVKAVYLSPASEIPFPSREHAEQRKDFLNKQGANIEEIAVNPDGTFSAGNPEELGRFYDSVTPKELTLDKTIINNFNDVKFDSNNKIIEKDKINMVCKIHEDKADYVDTDFTRIDFSDDDWVDASLVAFANNNYLLPEKEFKEKFLQQYPNWAGDVLRFDYSDEFKEIVAVKNDDKNEMIMMFRGSQNMRDWRGNIDVGFIVPSNVMNKRLGQYDIGDDNDGLNGHRGFIENNKKLEPFIRDILTNRANEKTKIRMTAHSRGNAIGTHALIIASEDFEGVKYRSFGGISFLEKDSSEYVSEITQNQNIVNYMQNYDPLRLINMNSPFYSIGDNIIVDTGESIPITDPTRSHDIKDYMVELSQPHKSNLPFRPNRDSISVSDMPTYKKLLGFFVASLITAPIIYYVLNKYEPYDDKKNMMARSLQEEDRTQLYTNTRIFDGPNNFNPNFLRDIVGRDVLEYIDRTRSDYLLVSSGLENVQVDNPYIEMDNVMAEMNREINNLDDDIEMGFENIRSDNPYIEMDNAMEEMNREIAVDPEIEFE